MIIKSFKMQFQCAMFNDKALIHVILQWKHSLQSFIHLPKLAKNKWNFMHTVIFNNNVFGCNIGFPGQFRRFVILFDEGVIQIREINLGHGNSLFKFVFRSLKFALRSRNLAFTSFKLKYASRAFKFATRARKRLFEHSNSHVGIQIRNKIIQLQIICFNRCLKHILKFSSKFMYYSIICATRYNYDHLYACMYVCMHACMYVCMYTCVHVRMCVWMYI